MFTDQILIYLMDIYQSIAGIDSDNNIMKTLDQFSGGIYRGVNTISQTVVMPVALVILSLFLLLELYNVVVRFDSSQSLMGIELPMKILFKAVIYKIVIDKTGVIMAAIFNVTTELMHGMKGVIGSTPSAIAVNYADLRKALGSMSFGQSLMTVLMMFLVWLLVKFIYLGVQVIIFGRFLEIFVLIAVAPIPLATLPHSDLSSIAKNFFKNFAAVCLHGVLLYLILSMVPMLINEVVVSTIDGTNFVEGAWKILLYSAVLGVAVTGSSRWAKAICNVM